MLTVQWPTIIAAFLASLVEFVEALTIVLAVGAVRGWRPALVGAAGAAGLLFDSFDAPFFTLQRPDGVMETHPYPDPVPVHLPFVEALLRVYHGEPIPHVTGQEGLKTNAVTAQIPIGSAKA